MKKRKIVLMMLPAVMAVSLIGFNVFASENSNQNQNCAGGDGPHMNQLGPMNQNQTFAKWKENEIKRINSITDEMFARMKEKMNIEITIDVWKQQEIDKVNAKTEAEFNAMKESFPRGRGMGFERGLGLKTLDISSLDYSAWKEEMIKNINAVSEDDYNKAKESLKNFQAQKVQASN